MHSRFLVVYKETDEIHFTLLSDSDWGDFNQFYDNLVSGLGEARNGYPENYNRTLNSFVEFINKNCVKRWSVQTYTLESWPEDEIITKVVYIPELGA